MERRVEDLAGSGREGMASRGVEATLEKKYGGVRPKKKPLISKGSGRVFFDSADWALCQQGEDTRAAVETLRPKLQPTPHQRLPPRRPACRSVRDDKVMKQGELLTFRNTRDQLY
ncbi:unnamed protein product [Spirodela intermedia]|uniref:Uncharacterized protein n=1 Tax=Spirodela intermedia TaxID=51605 RepID=A0A7I8IYA5_SPIIN|nr:unnamed protein product [Spirodela intermedia]CAA6661991.1 unnamed protein product [Spirodela intermedia]